MTRINLVDPSHLTNQHLMAEYRELPRIFTAVKKLFDEGKWDSYINSGQIPDTYILGEGHVKFFYNKLYWLGRRYIDLYHELTSNRKFNIDTEMFHSVLRVAGRLIQDLNEDTHILWKPTPEEIYLNMARICRRSKLDNVLQELSATN